MFVEFKKTSCRLKITLETACVQEELRKYLGIALVFLEIILAGCFVLLSFIYGIWMESYSASQMITAQSWIMEGIKRQGIITLAGFLVFGLVHSVNLYWIKITGTGLKKNSFIFSAMIFVLMFLSGLAGVILFIMQGPAAG